MQTFQKGAIDPLVYPLRELPDKSDRLADPHIGDQQKMPDGFPRPGDQEFERQVELFKSCRGDVTQGIWPQKYIDTFQPGLKPRYLPPVFEMIHANQSAPLVDVNNPETAANLVQMDRPYDLGQYLFDWLWSIGTPLRSDPTISKYGKHDYMLGASTDYMKFLSDNLADCYHDFMSAKYYFGMPRPEEYFDLPGCIVTQYGEGCPKHPSLPAGHGAFAGRTYRVTLTFFKIIDSIVQRALWLACWFFAHFRTFAGVHWAMDNDAGLHLGRRELRSA